MNPEVFRQSTSGRVLRSPLGYGAFVPNPLSPELKWTPDLIVALSDANRGAVAVGGARAGESPTADWRKWSSESCWSHRSASCAFCRALAEAGHYALFLAQKMTYCLRKMGVVEVAGKRREAVLYSRKPLAGRKGLFFLWGCPSKLACISALIPLYSPELLQHNFR